MAGLFSLEKVEASKVLNELGYLKEVLDKADDPFVEASWLDVAESWMAMAKLIPKMHSERCQGVLGCIFADEAVLQGLGAAMQFEGIVGDPPPPEGMCVEAHDPRHQVYAVGLQESLVLERPKPDRQRQGAHAPAQHLRARSGGRLFPSTPGGSIFSASLRGAR